MMREHARGNLHPELMKGAIEIAEELRRQWQQVGMLRDKRRYADLTQHDDGVPTSWGLGTLKRLDPSASVARRFTEVLFSRCTRCGTVRVRGNLELARGPHASAERRQAILYAGSVRSGAAFRWTLGACGSDEDPDDVTYPANHDWQQVPTPEWATETGGKTP